MSKRQTQITASFSVSIISCITQLIIVYVCVCVCVRVQACVCLISSGFKSLMVQSEMYVTIKQQKNCALHNPHWQNLQIP